MNKSGWIKIADGLPPDCLAVLVKVNYSKIPTVGHYWEHGDEWCSTAPGVNRLEAFYCGTNPLQKRFCSVESWAYLPEDIE